MEFLDLILIAYVMCDSLIPRVFSKLFFSIHRVSESISIYT